MKKSVLVLALLFFTVICSGSLIAKERHGAELVITKIDGQQITGELIAVKSSSLLLLDSQSGVDVSADVSDIKAIRIVRKVKYWVAGIPIAIAAGLASTSPTEGAWAAAIIFYGLPLAIPLVLLTGKDKTIQIAGKSPEEIEVVMEELRSKARVTDLQ